MPASRQGVNGAKGFAAPTRSPSMPWEKESQPWKKVSLPWEVSSTAAVFTARRPAENRCYVKNFTNDVIFFTYYVIFFT